MSVKPSLSKGTRDFFPLDVARRKYILGIIEDAFKKYGFQPIETPAVENLSTLTGKYGNEGEKLLFHIRSNKNIREENPQINEALTGLWDGMLPDKSDRGLRYDLTVPMARFVSMYWDKLPMPFKRYQIQPVWRGDRPQKGRYQEFYQCDADMVGSTSLFNELELIHLYSEVFSNLGFKEFTIKINNRKILTALASVLGIESQLASLLMAMDKIDKIGLLGFKTEAAKYGIPESVIDTILPLLDPTTPTDALIQQLDTLFESSEEGKLGLSELTYLLNNARTNHLAFDLSLARGLDYYTGTIFEVVTHEVQMGSLGGGGRYDNLTEVFGLKNMSGVGISFGAERILDCLVELNRFPENLTGSDTKVLIVTFDDASFQFGMEVLYQLRDAGIASELFPEVAKMKKQMKYADQKQIPFVAIIGETELNAQSVSLKNMTDGNQSLVNVNQLIQTLHG